MYFYLNSIHTNKFENPGKMHISSNEVCIINLNYELERKLCK